MSKAIPYEPLRQVPRGLRPALARVDRRLLLGRPPRLGLAVVDHFSHRGRGGARVDAQDRTNAHPEFSRLGARASPAGRPPTDWDGRRVGLSYSSPGTVMWFLPLALSWLVMIPDPCLEPLLRLYEAKTPWALQQPFDELVSTEHLDVGACTAAFVGQAD